MLTKIFQYKQRIFATRNIFIESEIFSCNNCGFKQLAIRPDERIPGILTAYEQISYAILILYAIVDIAIPNYIRTVYLVITYTKVASFPGQ